MKIDQYFWYIISAYGITFGTLLVLIIAIIKNSLTSKKKLKELTKNGKK
jgi:heme exporter protein CcmD